MSARSGPAKGSEALGYLGGHDVVDLLQERRRDGWLRLLLGRLVRRRTVGPWASLGRARGAIYQRAIALGELLDGGILERLCVGVFKGSLLGWRKGVVVAGAAEVGHGRGKGR